MKIGSLFSGVGGLELGLEWAGVGETVWQVERDRFCRGVPYEIAPEVDGRALTKTSQIRMCGNSVCPPVAAAIVAANLARGEVIAA